MSATVSSTKRKTGLTAVQSFITGMNSTAAIKQLVKEFQVARGYLQCLLDLGYITDSEFTQKLHETTHASGGCGKVGPMTPHQVSPGMTKRKTGRTILQAMLGGMESADPSLLNELFYSIRGYLMCLLDLGYISEAEFNQKNGAAKLVRTNQHGTKIARSATA